MFQAFLSHAGADKDFVRGVFDALGAGICIYDETYFRTGATNDAHMEKLVNECGLFVLFWSAAATNSDGLQRELELLRRRMQRDNVPLLAFIVDSSTTWRDVPDWLQHYPIEVAASPVAVARRIGSAVWEEKARRTPSVRAVFVNRDHERSAMADAITSPTGECPSTLVIAGWEGAGRRSLLTQVLRNTLPFSPANQPHIVLGPYQGLSELFRQLLHLDGIKDPAELAAVFSGFDTQEFSDQVTAVVAQLKRRTAEREVVILNADNSIVDDDGQYQHWFSAVLRAIPRTDQPILAVIQRRNVRTQQKNDLPSVLFVHVSALAHPAASLALRTHLKAHGVQYSTDQIDDLLPFLGGHPGDIVQAALYARDNGLERLITDKRDFLEMTRRRAIGLLARLNINLTQAALLQTLIEYHQVSLADLLTVSFPADEGDQAVRLRSLDQLVEHSVIQRVGKYYLVAPFLTDALGRFISGHEKLMITQSPKEKQRRANSLLDLVTERAERAGVDSMTVEASIIAAIRNPSRQSASWITPLILPSHLLTVAQEAYNDKDFETAQRLAHEALKSKVSLTIDATVAAYRVQALSAIRLGIREIADESLKGLDRVPGKNAEKNLYFIQGFRHRTDGNLDEAEASFQRCLSLDSRNFHAMREVSRLLIHQDRHKEAERFARNAFAIAPTSPFILDTLCSVLIGKPRPAHERREDGELSDILAALKQQDELQGTMFYTNRRASFLQSIGQTKAAFEMANDDCTRRPNQFEPLFLRARLSLHLGKLVQAEADIGNLRRMVASREPPNRQDEHRVVELDIQFSKEAGNIGSAIRRLRTTKRLPHASYVRLSRTLAEIVATSKESYDHDLNQWANSVLTQQPATMRRHTRTKTKTNRRGRKNDISELVVGQVLPGHIVDINHRVGVFINIGAADALMPRRLVPSRRLDQPYFGLEKGQPMIVKVLSLDRDRNHVFVDVVTLASTGEDA